MQLYHTYTNRYYHFFLKESVSTYYIMDEDSSDSATYGAQSSVKGEEKQSVQGQIAIKGTRNGLLLTLEPETPFVDLLNALSERLAESPSFFRGASLAVDTSRRLLRNNERLQLEDLLSYYQVSMAPLEQMQPLRKKTAPLPDPLSVSGSPMVLAQGSSLEGSFRADALMASQQGGETSSAAHTQREVRESMDTLFLRRTVRSGQAIHHSSNIVVMGDVNHGAEIVAGGDIMVWGVLRGMVHAGYPDNENASVCALLLAPVQLRIAHLLSRPPEGVEVQPRPEVATIRQGQIVVETWINGRPPRNR